MSSRRSPSAVVALLLGVVLLSAPVPGHAQEDETLPSLWVPEYEKTTVQLNAARRLEEAGRIVQALDLYEKVLLGAEHEVYPDPATSGGGKYRLYHGVRAHCRGELERLAREHMELYQRMSEAAARTLLRQALSPPDEKILERFVARYSLTPYGLPARRTLVGLYMESGRFEHALRHLEVLLELQLEVLSGEGALSEAGWRCSVDSLREELLRIAACYRRLGYGLRLLERGWIDPEVLAAVPLELRRTLGERWQELLEGVRRAPRLVREEYFRGRVTLGANCYDLQEYFLRVLVEALEGREASSSEWVCFGGNPRQCAEMTSRAAGVERWSERVIELSRGSFQTASERELMELAALAAMEGGGTLQLFDPLLGQGKAAPFEPVLWGQVAVVHDGKKATPINLDEPRAAAWTMRDIREHINPDGTPGVAAVCPFYSVLQRDILFVPLRVGKLQSGRRGFVRFGYFAFKLRTQGKLLWQTEEWRTSAQQRMYHAPSREFFEKASFIGGGCAVGGNLFVPALVLESDAALYLCCLNAGDGRLRWATLVCAQDIGAAGAPLVLLPPLPPMVEGDRVYFCTNNGALGCFDALTGETSWLAKYAGNPATRSLEARVAGRLPATWAHNPVLSMGEALFVAPQNSNDAFIFEKSTGRLLELFNRSEDLQRAHYVVGNAEGEVAVLGTEKLFVFHPWRREGPPPLFDYEYPPLPAVPIGRGGFAKRWLYVPTRKGVVAVNMAARESNPILLHRWEEGGPKEAAGLYVFGDRILVLEPTRATVLVPQGE